MTVTLMFNDRLKRVANVTAALREVSLESGVIDNLRAAALQPTSRIDGLSTISRDASRKRIFRKPNWLSPEIIAVMIGALDFCLVLAAAAAAFGTYPEIVGQTVACPGPHILTSLLAATVFASLLARLGAYRLEQLSRFYWQLKRIVMTWVVTVAVLLLIACFSKTSDIYSHGWALAWIVTVPVLLLIGRGVLHIVLATGAGVSCFTRNIVIVGAGAEGQR